MVRLLDVYVSEDKLDMVMECFSATDTVEQGQIGPVSTGRAFSVQVEVQKTRQTPGKQVQSPRFYAMDTKGNRT